MMKGMDMERLGYEFTLDELIDKVRELAAAHPDTRYDSDKTERGEEMSYKRGVSQNDASMPGCLFGQLLPLDWVETDYPLIISAALLNHRPGGGLLDEPVFDVDAASDRDPRLKWLRTVQSQQDGGSRWADAVRHADQSMEVPF